MSTTVQLEAATDQLREDAFKIASEKRPVYTNGDGDVLWNFKTISRMTGLTVGQVMAVYMAKQMLSVISSLGPNAKPDPEGSTRMADTLNYMELVNLAQRTGEYHERG